jgi:hypothetical protein
MDFGRQVPVYPIGSASTDCILCQLLSEAAKPMSLYDLTIQKGFNDNIGGVRAYRVGIDARYFFHCCSLRYYTDTILQLMDLCHLLSPWEYKEPRACVLLCTLQPSVPTPHLAPFCFQWTGTTKDKVLIRHMWL